MDTDNLKEMAVFAPVNTFLTKWCVYECYSKADALNPAYMGVCRLTEVFSFPDAQANTAWREMFRDNPASLMMIKIKYVAATEVDCINARRAFVMQNPPPCNMRGRPTRSRIVCDQTGQEWKTIVEAADAIKSSPSNLSNHINRKPGFKSVKGYTFTRQER